MVEKKITKEQCLDEVLVYCEAQFKELENILKAVKGHPENFPLFYEKYDKLGKVWYDEAAFYQGLLVSENVNYFKNEAGMPLTRTKTKRNTKVNGYS